MLKQDTSKLKENPCVFFEVTALKHEAMFILLLSIVFFNLFNFCWQNTKQIL